VEERRFSAASEARQARTESRRDGRSAAGVRNKTRRQHRCPPLQRTQRRSTPIRVMDRKSKPKAAPHAYERCHKLLWRIPKRNTGPVGRFFFSARNAALEGPLFHGIIGGIARRDESAGVRGQLESAAAACGDVEERRFSAASEARQTGTEPRRDGRSTTRIRNKTQRRHRRPPLQRTQGRGTRSRMLEGNQGRRLAIRPNPYSSPK